MVAARVQLTLEDRSLGYAVTALTMREDNSIPLLAERNGELFYNPDSVIGADLKTILDAMREIALQRPYEGSTDTETD